jgi:hypothetical protein
MRNHTETDRMSMSDSSNSLKCENGRLTWKTAISNAWTMNNRDYIKKSVIISSIAPILRMLQGFVIQGLVLWIILGSIMLLLHISEDARLQRKAVRLSTK